ANSISIPISPRGSTDERSGGWRSPIGLGYDALGRRHREEPHGLVRRSCAHRAARRRAHLHRRPRRRPGERAAAAAGDRSAAVGSLMWAAGVPLLIVGNHYIRKAQRYGQFSLAPTLDMHKQLTGASAGWRFEF